MAVNIWLNSRTLVSTEDGENFALWQGDYIVVLSRDDIVKLSREIESAQLGG